MADKDFLNQFSGSNNIPDSFKEEERTPVTKKPKKPVNKFVLIGLFAGGVVLGVLAYFIFFAPKIEMPDFVYQSKNDVSAWVKQQKIETTGIIFNEEYNFDYDADTILNQDVKPGTKVKNDAKITFTISLGADPDETVSVPDIQSMDKAEIKDWISENKLTKTKVSTAYSDTVEEDQVISYSFSGCEEDTFTRSCSLKISVSKGTAPAGTLAIEDYSKKDYSVVETWAKSKKVTLTKVEAYSNTVDKGLVISTTPEAGKTLKEGETLTVTVSKGKAVKVIDFTDMSKEDITKWCTKNSVVANYIERYSDVTENCFISCAQKAGTIIGSGDTIDITISIGNPDAPSTFTTLRQLEDWVKEVNLKGADLELVNDGDRYDDTAAPGTLAHYETENDVGDHVHYSISKGKNVYVSNEFDLATMANKTESAVRAILDDNNHKLTYQIIYRNGTAAGETINNVLEIYYLGSNNTHIPPVNMYIGQDVTIYVVVCDKTYSAG